jgi:hypothetical protein
METCKVVNIKNEPYDIFIGRPSKWGNPFKIGDDGMSRSDVIKRYRDYILGDDDLMDSIHELVGQTLGCYCKPKSCHGDVLVELTDRLNVEADVFAL